MSSKFKRISFGNLNSVMSDKIIYDSNSHELLFVSLIGYTSIIDASLATLSGGITGCYSSAIGSIRTLRSGYEVEVRKQNDSDYVHAIAYAKDVVNQTEEGEEIFATLFCPNQIVVNSMLFDKLTKLSSVPVLMDWIPYIKTEMIVQRQMIPLTIIGVDENDSIEAFRISTTKNKLKGIIQKGLRDGEINIRGINTSSPLLSEIKGLNDYLSCFGELLAEKIQNSFRPKFIPGDDPYDEFTNNVDDSVFSSNIEMYEAQKSVIQAAVNNLKVNDSTFVIGEMGSGKSLIGSCIPYAHHAKRNKGFNAIVLCPAHLTIKWKREIERAVPNSRAYIVSDFHELKALEKKLRNPRKVENSYIIVSKERAKMGYDLKPAAIWSKSKKTFVCPECGQTLYTKEYEGSGRNKTVNYIPFDELSMSKELAVNARCMNDVKVWDEENKVMRFEKCNAKLWEPLNRDEVNSKWIKLGKEGWIMKDHIVPMTEHLMSLEKLGKKDSALFNRLFEQYQRIQDGEAPYVKYKGPKKYPISKYIRRNMKEVFDYALIDEAHQYKGLTEQGQAAADIMQVSKKSILLTGTLLNGYADGLFYLLYRTVPKLMKSEGFGFNNESDFARIYGVYSREARYRMERGMRRNKVGSFKEKRLPGVSPLVFTKFLLNHAVFLSLSDMSDGLPEYEEIPVAVEMDDELRENYYALENEFRNFAAPRRGQSRKIVGPLLQSLTVYPDAPHCADPILDPDTGDVAVTPVRMDKELRNKEVELLNLVRRRLDRGEKVLVYYNSVNKTDVGKTLVDLLNDNNITAFEMKSSVAADEREEWVEKHLDRGMEVMICNPALVETGLDLLDFTSIVFYQIGYNLFTMRQASRRSWRLSQKNAVKVFFMYYQGSIQEQALSLMATKLQASMAIEGKFSEEGLRAMSQNEDMLTQIANNVVEGIKDTVNEDLFKSATFVKASSRVIREHFTTREKLEVRMNEDGIKSLFSKKFDKHNKNVYNKYKSDEKVRNILKLFC